MLTKFVALSETQVVRLDQIESWEWVYENKDAPAWDQFAGAAPREYLRVRMNSGAVHDLADRDSIEVAEWLDSMFMQVGPGARDVSPVHDRMLQYLTEQREMIEVVRLDGHDDDRTLDSVLEPMLRSHQGAIELAAHVLRMKTTELEAEVLKEAGVEGVRDGT